MKQLSKPTHNQLCESHKMLNQTIEQAYNDGYRAGIKAVSNAIEEMHPNAFKWLHKDAWMEIVKSRLECERIYNDNSTRSTADN